MAGEALFAPLFREKLLEEIVYAAQPTMVYDKIAVKMPLDKSIAEYVKSKDDYPLTFKEVAPAASMENDEIEWERQVVKPKKFASTPRIPQEVIDDEDFKTISLYTDQLGLAYSRKINSDCLTTSVAGIGGDTTQAVTGGVWSGAGSDPVTDVSKTKGKVETYNYIPDRLVLHPLRFSELQVDSTFIVATSWSKEQLETGQVPMLNGMQVLKTAQHAEATVSMYDQMKYMWYFERKPLTIEVRRAPSPIAAVDIAADTRYSFEVVRAKAAGLITGVA